MFFLLISFCLSRNYPITRCFPEDLTQMLCAKEDSHLTLLSSSCQLQFPHGDDAKCAGNSLWYTLAWILKDKGFALQKEVMLFCCRWAMENDIIIRLNTDCTKIPTFLRRVLCCFGFYGRLEQLHGLKKRFKFEFRVTVLNTACKDGPNVVCFLEEPHLCWHVSAHTMSGAETQPWLMPLSEFRIWILETLSGSKTDRQNNDNNKKENPLCFMWLTWETSK